MAELTDARRPELNRRRLLQAGALTAAAAAAPRGARAAAPESSRTASDSLLKPAAMRSPKRRRARTLAEKAPPPNPTAVIVALNRMGFGPRPGDIPAFRALGSTAESQLAAYVAQQLDPAGIDDTDFETRFTQV